MTVKKDDSENVVVELMVRPKYQVIIKASTEQASSN